MGAWGHRPFENDDALDFVGEDVSLKSIENVFQTALDSDYLDADDASRCIAAAEIVAALKGHAVRPLPAALEDCLGRRDLTDLGGPNAKLVSLATRAVRRTLKPTTSELASLWSGTTAWAKALGGLLQRLAARPATRSKPKRKSRLSTRPRNPAFLYFPSPTAGFKAYAHQSRWGSVEVGLCISNAISDDAQSAFEADRCEIGELTFEWTGPRALRVVVPSRFADDALCLGWAKPRAFKFGNTRIVVTVAPKGVS